MTRKLKMGMVGGGPGAFIGEVHRKAARIDGDIELVAGAFDIDPEKSRQTGRELGIDEPRIYGDYLTMLEKESALPAEERIDFVSICTPNHTHFPIATRIPAGHPDAFLEAFANNYLNFSDTIRAKERKEKPSELIADFPGMKEGVAGMKFIEAVVQSSANNAVWTAL